MATKYEYHTYTANCGAGRGFSDTQWVAQTFKPVIAHTITEVQLGLYDIVGTVVVEIKAVDVNGKPTGAALATGTGTGIFALSPLVDLVAGTQYAIVIYMQNPGETARIYADRAAGIGQLDWLSTDSGASWAAYAAWGPCNPWPYYHTDLAASFSEWGNPMVAPAVTTQAVTAIALTTATGNGNITDLGNPTATQHGHCWSVSANPTIANSKTENGVPGGTGAFTSDITGLTAETNYHTRAYATNSWGTGYGADRMFTTKKVSKVPAVRTYGVTNIELDSAILIGELTDDGGEACEVGFEWGLTALYGKDTTWQGGKHTGDAFWQLIASLEPDTTYHFRAQARNSVGTGSGEDMVFKTKRREEAEVGVPYSVLNPALLLLMEEEPVFV